jgi:hypothetical protein
MDCCVMCTNVVLTLVVIKFFLPWVVFDIKLFLCKSIYYPKSIEQNLCCMTVFSTILAASELLQCIGAGG